MSNDRAERRLASHRATLREIDEGKLTLKDLIARQKQRQEDVELLKLEEELNPPEPTHADGSPYEW